MDIIFLTGHRKAGTSVFHKLFEGHPELNSFPFDPTIFYAYFPQFMMENTEEAQRRERIRKIYARIMADLEGLQPPEGTKPFHFDAFWAGLNESLSAKDLEDRPVLLRKVLEAYAAVCGMDPRKTWVVKETTQAMFAHKFAAPGMRFWFINLLRDPRDNYGALKAGVKGYYAKLGENELKTLASLINRARMDFLASMTNPNLLTVRFEDLCANTRKEMERICYFTGIAFDDCLLTPTRMGSAYGGNSHEGTVFQGLSSENVGRWRERISDQEAMIIEFWLKDVMAAYGYESVFEDAEKSAAFTDFYQWYNSTYFFSDPYRNA